MGHLEYSITAAFENSIGAQFAPYFGQLHGMLLRQAISCKFMWEERVIDPKGLVTSLNTLLAHFNESVREFNLYIYNIYCVAVSIKICVHKTLPCSYCHLPNVWSSDAGSYCL